MLGSAATLARVKRPSAAGLAWSLFAVTVLLLAVSLVFTILNPPHAEEGDGWGTRWGLLVYGITFLAFPIVGALIASRRVGGPIGWICLAVGFAFALTGATDGYAVYGILTNPGSLPAADVMAWIQSWLWLFFIGLPAIFLVLLFPDGHLLSRRWRPLVWIAGFAIVIVVASIALHPGPLDEAKYADNPLGIDRAKPVLEAVNAVGLFLLLSCLIASAISMVLRFRRSRGEERLQLKWFASGASATVLVFCGALVIGAFAPSRVEGIAQDAATTGWAVLPIAAGIAVFRYRLYDIDVVINKALVFGALAAFITAVYVGIVVGFSALLGRAGNPNIALSVLGTAIVAVAFQPARVRAQHLANRLVYGKRATPYEVLAEFSEQAATTVATEEVLPKVARTVGEGTGAARSEVWIRSGPELRLAASWPGSAPNTPRRITLDDGRLPESFSAQGAVPVRHHDELLGALTVVKPRGEAISVADEKLLADLASQAGLVLRNVGLTAELLARLDELTASRQRLVSAQDEERRRLERNLHDGAQQHLVALKVKLNLAARRAEDPELKELLTSLQADTDETVEALRELARGI
jgi:signal transduction histidine kinase